MPADMVVSQNQRDVNSKHEEMRQPPMKTAIGLLLILLPSFGATGTLSAAEIQVASLPPSGSGFPATGNQSLERFANGQIKTLAALDGSTTYTSWADLVATLRAILKHEQGSASAMKLNMAELDMKLNPGDHSDHLTTAKAVLEAAQEFPQARRIHYIDYASAELAPNLTPEERDIENSVFTVTVAGILALDHSHHWDDLHRSWIGRSYSREVPHAAGTSKGAP